MGCRQSKPAFEKKSPENEKLEKYEDSIGFKRNESAFYEGIISRLQNSSLSPSQMIESFQKFSKLALPEPLLASLLRNFQVEGGFDFKAFRCFCIVLSKSSEIDKGEALWYTFDKGLEDVLQIEAIRNLLQILIRISVKITLELAISEQVYEVEKLNEWKVKLTERLESAEIRLLKHFTQGKEVVSKIEFMLRLQDRPEGLITTMPMIRSQIEHTQVIPKKFATPFKNMRVTKLTS